MFSSLDELSGRVIDFNRLFSMSAGSIVKVNQIPKDCVVFSGIVWQTALQLKNTPLIIVTNFERLLQEMKVSLVPHSSLRP